MKLALDKINCDGGTQTRAAFSVDVTKAYAEAMAEGRVFPPVVVFYDGKAYWLADGFHRIGAANANDWEEIDADVRQGTVRDAILYSVGANSDHGCQRTPADKRRAVETLLRDEEWRKKSNRWIADVCRVSDPFVGQLRKATANVCSSGDSETRTGKDGKERKQPAAKPKPAKPSRDQNDFLRIQAALREATTRDEASAAYGQIRPALESGRLDAGEGEELAREYKTAVARIDAPKARVAEPDPEATHEYRDAADREADDAYPDDGSGAAETDTEEWDEDGESLRFDRELTRLVDRWPIPRGRRLVRILKLQIMRIEGEDEEHVARKAG